MTKMGQDQQAIASFLRHSCHKSWFEYNAGLRLIFFRFPGMYMREARDGVKMFFEKPGPMMRSAQATINDSGIQTKVREKIAKVIWMRYLNTEGVVIKLNIKYFAGPKGDEDIHMVYDTTANNLNDAVWVLTFWLPTIDMPVQNVGQESWMMDRDVGDMFLNYQLHEDVRPLHCS
ncbi:hypothetical protein ACHAXA_008387 [Cyclostephanos tholiformis]|uniref:Uncharacterized protein n=1 Tax=Cyclostephanos tholiformis TaxID=382380 RepID=A0ABD3RVS3_9STRA